MYMAVFRILWSRPQAPQYEANVFITVLLTDTNEKLPCMHIQNIYTYVYIDIHTRNYTLDIASASCPPQIIYVKE